MLLASYLAVILHILTAATYFGLALPYARMARGYAESGHPLLRDQIGRITRLMTQAAVLTLLFGATAFVTRGLAAGVSPFVLFGPEYHTSLLLVLILVGVQIALIQANWNLLQLQVANSEDTSGSVRKIAMGTGIAHLIWVIVLVLMFWPRLSLAI